MLSDADRDYIARRRNSLRFLHTATWALPLFWVAGCTFAASRFPRLIDPFGIAAELDAGTIEWGMLRALARLTPVLFLTLLAVVSGTVFIFLRAAHREKRLLDLVARVEQSASTAP